MASRLVFEILLEANVTAAGFIDILVKPAEKSGLGGRITRVGQRRYTVVLEGCKDAILMFEAVLDYIVSGIGTVGGMHSSHGHESNAFHGVVSVGDQTKIGGPWRV